MRRTAVLLCAGVILAAAPAGAAVAGPSREFLPLPPQIVLEGVCPSFDIVADILVNREYAITFTDANGDPVRTITTGSLVVRLTNPENDASEVLNISGPGVTTYHADGSTTLKAHGSWYLFYFPGQLGAGSEGTSFLHTGAITVVTADDGTAVFVSDAGRTEDICETLG
jgi:hypothetical protein